MPFFRGLRAIIYCGFNIPIYYELLIQISPTIQHLAAVLDLSARINTYLRISKLAKAPIVVRAFPCLFLLPTPILHQLTSASERAHRLPYHHSLRYNLNAPTLLAYCLYLTYDRFLLTYLDRSWGHQKSFHAIGLKLLVLGAISCTCFAPRTTRHHFHFQAVVSEQLNIVNLFPKTTPTGNRTRKLDMPNRIH